MTKPGLSLVAPDLVGILERTDEDGRRRAVAVACDLAVERAGLRDARIDQARSALASGVVGDVPERQAVQALTEELDSAAWETQDQAEAGTASQQDYLRAFAKARAAATVGFAFELDSLTAAFEALYEAHHAIQDVDTLRTAVNNAIR